MKDLALRLPARDAQRVLLVHALEEADRSGSVLDLDVRRSATRDAVDSRAGRDGSTRGTGRWLARRARTLVAGLTAEGSPYRTRLRRLLRFSDPARGLALPLAIAAFVVGVASNALGPERHVNLLAPPLLALILWNLAIFALLGLRWLVSWAHPPAGAPVWVSRLEGWIRRWSLGGRQRTGSDGWAKNYLARWLPAARRLAAARLSRSLHLAALSMVTGVVAGMYLRGLVLAYRATWESTFLGASQVEALLGRVLAPATVVLGSDLPSVAALEAPADGPAALWIHLWAVTAALFVGLPRLLLATRETLRAWRAGRRIELVLPAAYPKRLRASASASTPEVQVLPFSFRPAERATQTLRELLQDLTGARSHVRFAPSLDYGSEAPEPFDGSLRVVVFSLSQTPEVEVHGELLRTLRAELPDGQGLLVLVDESPLRRKLENLAGEIEEERLDSRRRAWRRVVDGAELAAVFVDLERPPAMDSVLDDLGRAVWPAASDALAWSA